MGADKLIAKKCRHSYVRDMISTPLTEAREQKNAQRLGGGAARSRTDNHADYEASFVVNLHSCGVLSAIEGQVRRDG